MAGGALGIWEGYHQTRLGHHMKLSRFKAAGNDLAFSLKISSKIILLCWHQHWHWVTDRHESKEKLEDPTCSLFVTLRT